MAFGKQFQRDSLGSLLTGLVAYWKFEDANDYYSTYNFTSNTNITFDAGKVNNAADGAASGRLYQTPAVLASNTFSLSKWEYFPSALMKGCFFANGNIAGNRHFKIGVGDTNFDGNGNNLLLEIDGNYRSFGAIGTGWHHIVLLCDAGVCTVYKDNILLVNTFTYPSINIGNTFTTALNYDVTINYPFTGKLDETGFWNRVLNAQEISDLWNDGDGQTMISISAPSTAVSAQRATGIKKVYIKTGSETWQTLGGIRNGLLKVTPETSNDAAQNNLAVGSYLLESKFELLQTSVAEMEKIDSILDGTNSFLFQLTDAVAITASSVASEGWATVSNSQIGVKARYVSENDPSGNQYIEIMIQGSLLSTELDTALKATIVDTDFHISTTASESFSNNNAGVGGTLFGYYLSTTAGDNQGVLSNIKPNGFSLVEIKGRPDASYVSLGKIDTSKIIVDWLAQMDSLERFIVFNVDVQIEYDALVSDADTLLIYDTLNTSNTDARITLFDGKIFTFESKLGVDVTFENLGDFDKFRRLRFRHRGNILITDFDSIVS